MANSGAVKEGNLPVPVIPRWRMQQLVNIRALVESWNDGCRLRVWTKTADEIFRNANRPPTSGRATVYRGPDTCLEGYVWREAVAGDHVCVTPETRDQTAEDNRLADGRRIG